MKNILIITLGTREIQFLVNSLKDFGFNIENGKISHKENPEIEFQVLENQNFPQYVFPRHPRIAGKIIRDNIEIFKKIIRLPLIENALKNIIKGYEKIDEITFIYTDQKNLADDNSFKKLDTLYYSDLIAKYINQDQIHVDSIQQK